MEEAVTQGNIEGAKGAEAQPMSGGTAYATRFNQALAQSAQIDMQVKGVDHLGQLTAQYTAKPYTLENAQELTEKRDAYVQGVIEHAPLSLQGVARNILVPLNQSAKAQYSKYAYKQQLQSAVTRQRLLLNQMSTASGVVITQAGLMNPVAIQANYDGALKTSLSLPNITPAQQVTFTKDLTKNYAANLNDAFFEEALNNYHNAVNSKNEEKIKLYGDRLKEYTTNPSSIAHQLQALYPNSVGRFPIDKLETMVRHKGTDYTHSLVRQGQQYKSELTDRMEKVKLGYTVPTSDLPDAANGVPGGQKLLQEINDGKEFNKRMHQSGYEIMGYQKMLSGPNPVTKKWQRDAVEAQIKLKADDNKAWVNQQTINDNLPNTMPLAINASKNESETVKLMQRDPETGWNLVNHKFNSIDEHGFFNAQQQDKEYGQSLGVVAPNFFTNDQAKDLVKKIKELPTTVDRQQKWAEVRRLGINPQDVVSQSGTSTTGDMADATLSTQLADIVHNYPALYKAAYDKNTSGVSKSALEFAQLPAMIGVQQALANQPRLLQTIKEAVQGVGYNLLLGNKVHGLDMDFTHFFGAYTERTASASDQNQILNFVLKDLRVNVADGQPLIIPRSLKGVAVNAFQVSRNANALAKIAYKQAYAPRGDEAHWQQLLGRVGIKTGAVEKNREKYAGAPSIDTLMRNKALIQGLIEQRHGDNRAAYLSNYDATHYVVRSGSGLIMHYENADGSEGAEMIGKISDLGEGPL